MKKVSRYYILSHNFITLPQHGYSPFRATFVTPTVPFYHSPSGCVWLRDTHGALRVQIIVRLHSKGDLGSICEGDYVGVPMHIPIASKEC